MAINVAVNEYWSVEVPLSIYLHIPFCRTKCTYCAFNTYVNLEALVAPFVEALIREINILSSSTPTLQVGTIYFGGGTPSLLTPQQLSRILRAIRQDFDVLPGAEISLEANPNDPDTAYLAALRALGINRLSLGMQSAIPGELELFQRRHDHTMVVQAVAAARNAGFDNLNLDLIYGIPHQTLAHWETSLRHMLALQPEHISLYALGLEDGTPLKAWVENGRLPIPDDDLAADMYELATDMLEEAGYEQYEISNWSTLGYACRHNLQYWRNLPYAGLGPGAHGYAGGMRYAVILSPQRYVSLLNDSRSPSCEFPRTPVTDWAVVVEKYDEIAETLIMGLRLTQEGIDRAAFSQRFGVDLLDLHGSIIDRYVSHGLLQVNSQQVRLTRAGRLLSNVIFRELV